MIWTLPSSGVAGHGGEFRPLRHGHKVGLGGLLDREVQPVPEVVVDVLVQGSHGVQGDAVMVHLGKALHAVVDPVGGERADEIDRHPVGVAGAALDAGGSRVA